MIPSLLLTLAGAVTQVADTVAVAAPPETSIDEIVVTGTRAPKLLKNTPVQTTLITHADIERTDATDISDLLTQQMPGVEFSYAMNQQVHLNFGGFGGQSVLFLVDGERLAGETMDDVDFGRITMAGVERVEIVRGASSAIYGSNAAGGVINIITGRPRKKWGLNLDARIGRHNEQRYSADFRFRSKYVTNTLDVTLSGIESYNVNSAPDPATRVVTTIYGNKTCNISDRVTVSPMSNLKLSARAGFYFREIPRIQDTPERYRDFSGGLTAKWDITDNDNLEVSYSFDQYDKSSYMTLSGLDVRNYSNVTNAVRGLYNHTFEGGHILTAGADYKYDYLMNDRLTGRTRHEANVDAFAQMDWTIDSHWEAVGALRYDYFSDGDLSRLTPRLTVRYQPRYNMNIRFGYGMGFRAPTLKEKYYNFDMAGIWIVVGNASLKAETSHNLNASWDWTYRNYNATVTTYYNIVSDKIATGLPYYLPDDNKQLFLDYVNLDRYNVGGFDISLQGRWKNGLYGKLSYAYTHESFPKDKDGNSANNQYIPARKHSLTANVEWTREFGKNYKLTLGLNGKVLSGVTNKEYKDYYNIDEGTVDVHYPAYTMWKFSVTQRFFDKLKLSISVDNIFNYKPKYYYLNAPLTDGANLRIGLSYTI